MASLASAARGCYNMPVSDKYEHKRQGFSLSKVIFAGKRDPRDSVITNVATKMPSIVPSPEKDDVGAGRNHVAWTSVRQERWEGELLVQGEIPLWLVCALSHF